MDKKTQALKKARDALKIVWSEHEAITAIDDALAEQSAQQEPDDSLLLCASDLEHSAIYDNHVEMQSCIRAVASRIKIFTDPPAQHKPLTDEQILRLVPGLQDCLCDPWDYNNSGDYYASIPKDMIRLARAIEAAHGIKENT